MDEKRPPDAVNLRSLAEKAGICTDCWHMGAASMAYSEGCHGITLEHLQRFAGLVGFACWNAAIESSPAAMSELADAAVATLLTAADAAAPQAVRAVGAVPYCYVYEYDSPLGLHRALYPKQWNGNPPNRTVAVYTHPAPAPAVPEGYALVPVEPTPEMIAEAWRAIGGKACHVDLRFAWARMLAARPAQAAPALPEQKPMPAEFGQFIADNLHDMMDDTPAQQGAEAQAADEVWRQLEVYSGEDQVGEEVVLLSDVKRLLATPPAAPAMEAAPVALREVGLSRDTSGMCIVTVNGREAIRDNGDVISHFATLDWFAPSELEMLAVEELAQLGYTVRNGQLYPPSAPPGATQQAAEAVQPLAWLVLAKGGFVRACWTEAPSPEQLAVAEADGDTVIPCAAIDAAKAAQGEAGSGQ